MFEQITLKDKKISEKALHLSLQKIYSHKQGNNHSLDRSEVAGSGKKLLNKKELEMQELVTKKQLKEEVGEKLLGQNFMWFRTKLIKKSKKAP